MGFDPSSLKGSKFDFMLVDGPFGQGVVLSRFTAVEIAAAHLDEEFIVVFDDAERFGERRTIRKFEAMLRARDQKVLRSTTRAHKWQVVLASGAIQSQCLCDLFFVESLMSWRRISVIQLIRDCDSSRLRCSSG